MCRPVLCRRLVTKKWRNTFSTPQYVYFGGQFWWVSCFQHGWWLQDWEIDKCLKRGKTLPNPTSMDWSHFLHDWITCLSRKSEFPSNPKTQVSHEKETWWPMAILIMSSPLQVFWITKIPWKQFISTFIMPFFFLFFLFGGVGKVQIPTYLSCFISLLIC